MRRRRVFVPASPEKSALRRASLDVSGIFRRNRHSSGVPSPSSPFIRRAEPQHEKLRLEDGAAYHLPPQVRTESARRRAAGSLALRTARADRPEKPYRFCCRPMARRARRSAPRATGRRADPPRASAPRFRGIRRQTTPRSYPRRIGRRRLRRVARASMRAASSFRVFWPRLGRGSLSPRIPRFADLHPCVLSRLFVAGTRTRPGRTRCANCASPAAL